MDGRPTRVWALLVRHRWWVLGVWTALWSAAHLSAHAWGWHYFATGARLLTSGRALHLFALDPSLQSGPLAFLLVTPTLLVPPKLGEAAALVVMAALGLVAVRLVDAASAPVQRGPEQDAPIVDASGRPGAGLARLGRPDRVLVAGLLIVPVWAELAVHWSHPDDVVALLCLVGALAAVRRQRVLLAAALLAGAVDAKPWALIFVPLLLLAESRRRPRAFATLAVLVAVVWAPFVLADSRTLLAGAFQIPVSADSVLHLVGVRGGTPSWCRPAQLILGAALVATCVVRRRWHAALAVGVCARMLLDPGTKTYYDAGLVVATAVYDLVASAALPWLTIGALLTVYLPSLVPGEISDVRAALRAAFFVVAPALLLTWSPPARFGAAGTDARERPRAGGEPAATSVTPGSAAP